MTHIHKTPGLKLGLEDCYASKRHSAPHTCHCALRLSHQSAPVHPPVISILPVVPHSVKACAHSIWHSCTWLLFANRALSKAVTTARRRQCACLCMQGAGRDTAASHAQLGHQLHCVRHAALLLAPAPWQHLAHGMRPCLALSMFPASPSES